MSASNADDPDPDPTEDEPAVFDDPPFSDNVGSTPGGADLQEKTPTKAVVEAESSPKTAGDWAITIVLFIAAVAWTIFPLDDLAIPTGPIDEAFLWYAFATSLGVDVLDTNVKE